MEDTDAFGPFFTRPEWGIDFGWELTFVQVEDTDAFGPFFTEPEWATAFAYAPSWHAKSQP